LNQKLITARLNQEISQEDFQMMKGNIAAETEKIKEQISALDSERSTMEDLMQQAKIQMIDLVAAWKNADVNQKQELAKGLFPDGLVFSHERKFFELRNVAINEMASRFLEILDADVTPISPIGAGDGI
jgi:hypothetical protein